MKVALVVSVTINVLLAHKVRSLDNAQSARVADRLLQVGTTVPPITAKRLNGDSELISYQGMKQATVLYIFTPTCIWCARNLSNLKTLLDEEGGRYRFIGLSLANDGVAPYVANSDLNVPVYTNLSPETLSAYKLGSTPQTIVISQNGIVLQNWAGAYVGSQKSQVETFFHITLPGLTPTAEPSNATVRRN